MGFVSAFAGEWRSAAARRSKKERKKRKYALKKYYCCSLLKRAGGRENKVYSFLKNNEPFKLIYFVNKNNVAMKTETSRTSVNGQSGPLGLL